MERRKLISLELHAGTLVEYFKAKRIPRGLRPNLRPTLMPNNAQFCAKFEAIGNKYAFDIMLLNIEFLKKEIDSLGLKCDETKNALLTATSTDDLGSINSKIEENLLRFRTGLEDTKRSKWFRDLDDYNNGRIYGWQFRNTMPNKSTPGPGRSRGALRSTRKPHKQAAAHTSFGFTGSTNWFNVDNDLFAFFRRLKLALFFSDKERAVTLASPTHLSLDMFGLYNKSDFVPPVHDPVVDTFCKFVKADVAKLKSNGNRWGRSNLTYAERKEIGILKRNKSITIKPADKGGALVVMDTAQYVGEIRSQLSDTGVYERLQVNPTQGYKLELDDIIDEAFNDGLIDGKLVKYLKVEHPVVPVLYTLPKIHKDLRRPPGRPIVSGRGSLCNKVAIFLDQLLRRFATSAPSYVRDTSDFIKSLEGVQVEESTWLVSFDVTSLYTSIEHARGLSAVGVALAGSDMAPECARFALALLGFILGRNFFLFGDEFYLQRRGTAMGSNVAPTYANIYMAVLEGDHVYNSSFWGHVRGWRRYIDDIFLVWDGDRSELEAFHLYLNNIHPGLGFTMDCSQIKMQFLDTCVYKMDGLLHTDLFIKLTDRNNLLHFSSEHPRRMVESLPWSQLLRVRRVVSSDTLIDERLNEMCQKFLKRGYPKADLDRFKMRVLSKDRDVLLTPRVTVESSKRIPFVTAYNGVSNQISAVIRRHWPLLSRGHAHINEFQQPPLFSFRRNRNLRDELVASDVGSARRDLQTTLSRPSLGNFPCLGCACCNNMLKGAYFYHPHTGKKYEIRKRYTCKSNFVVYVLSCPCGLYYVGETTMEIKARISKHKSTIRTNRIELPVPKHFHEFGHSVNQLRFYTANIRIMYPVDIAQHIYLYCPDASLFVRCGFKMENYIPVTSAIKIN
ncbi:unnamed protein product [Ranitomeya imitator]|uniref:Reverse transcriptase domain-containing protein n=1 Tax=Ranitomeya imitator TaxID=111125 RepID=A0ABN9M1E7_9NEOB|nr:unnamed protein product [Ranitomeya imitator]